MTVSLLWMLLVVAVDPSLESAPIEYQAGLDARSDSTLAKSHFAKAATLFQRDWDSGNNSPDLCRQLAQSYLLAGDLGRSIRTYRLGLREFPHQPELLRDLDYASAQIVYPNGGELAEASRARDSTSWGIARNRMMPIALGAYCFGCFLGVRAYVSANGMYWVFSGLFGVSGIALGVLLWIDDRTTRERWQTPTAIVLSPGTEIRTGNNEEYPRRLEGRLPAGVELRILGERGGWLQVELANGTVGWIPNQRMVKVD